MQDQLTRSATRKSLRLDVGFLGATDVDSGTRVLACSPRHTARGESATSSLPAVAAFNGPGSLKAN